MSEPLLMGAVAYDPKVVTIWSGFRRWLSDRELAFDYVLYSHYERQVLDLVDGRIDAAWHSPLAWVRTRRMVPHARALVMRDTDRDLSSVVVVRTPSVIRRPADLAGTTVGTGAVDSPQGTLLPSDLLRQVDDVTIRHFDVGVGLHGDHIGGERDAARALMAGEVDAACMLADNLLRFTHEGTLPAGATRVLAQTAPFDHCTMTAVNDEHPLLERFVDLLLAMDYADPLARPLMDLEGLTRWLPGRTSRYAALEAAVDRAGFYDDKGAVTAGGYEP